MELGGLWGIGCAVCASALARVTGKERAPSDMKLTHRWRTKWASYEIRTRTSKVSFLLLHVNTAVHRRSMAVAKQLLVDPTFHLSRATKILTPEDQSGWKGRVPQLQAWIDVWAEVIGRSSYSSQVAVERKKKGRLEISYQQRVKMTWMMAEVVREHMRKELREATHISLALDGKGPRKVMRFMCDCPTVSSTPVS